MKIITLTLSPCFDVHCYAEDFRTGRENIVRTQSVCLGGKGINVSRALLENGFENTAVVAVADQGGAELCAELDKVGVDYRAIKVSGRVRNNITVHTASGKESRICFDDAVGNGAQLLADVYTALCELCVGECILAVAGSVPKGVDIDELCDALASLKQRGVRLVIDSRSFEKSHLSRLRPWLIKPNEQEIGEYAGREVTSVEDAVIAAKELRTLGIENVMVTLGSRGAVLCCDECEDGYFLPSPDVKVRSTIGAGDSTIAGFLAATLTGSSKKRALALSVCYGSAACMREGTLPPRHADIDALMKAFNDA